MAPPVIVTRSELALRLGDLLDTSLNSPVIVRKHGLAKNVLLSYDEYERLVADRQRYASLQQSIINLESTPLLKRIFEDAQVM